MGLMKELALLPVAPLRFTVWVSDKVAEEADQQQSSPQAHIQQLREIDEKRKRGELTEDEAAEAEAQIIDAEMSPTGGEEDEHSG